MVMVQTLGGGGGGALVLLCPACLPMLNGSFVFAEKEPETHPLTPVPSVILTVPRPGHGNSDPEAFYWAWDSLADHSPLSAVLRSKSQAPSRNLMHF